METMLDDLFGVCLDKTHAKNCEFQSISQDKVIPLSAAKKAPIQSVSQRRGLVSKLTRMFGRL